MALYVYGIMRSGDAERAVSAAEPARVQAVEHQHVSALVSGLPDGELRLRRDNILGHSDVLQAAFEHGPILPFRFGTVVADGEAVVRELLAPAAERLGQRLEALDGKVEMQVKATYAEEPLLRSVLAQDPELTQSVRRTQGLPAAASHFERIRIGEAVAGAVQARRAADEEALLRALSPLAVTHASSPPHHERSVLNAAFLVDRASLARFDQEVEALSNQRAPEIDFTLVGPLPPYSFADREWELAAVGR